MFASAGETQILGVQVEFGSALQSRDEVTCGAIEAIFQSLGSSPSGLTSSEARARLARFGPNRLKGKSRAASLTLLLGQFKSPIVLILIGAAILSIFLQDAVYEEEEQIFFEDRSGLIIPDDVFARLLTFPNVIITGHQAFFTREALENIAAVTVDNITSFENGLKLENQLI